MIADGSPAEMAGIATLCRFGTFSGTGAKLAHGFGQTAVASGPLTITALAQAHHDLRRSGRA